MQFGWIADRKRGEIWNKVPSSANILSGKMSARQSKKDKQCVCVCIYEALHPAGFSPPVFPITIHSPATSEHFSLHSLHYSVIIPQQNMTYEHHCDKCFTTHSKEFSQMDVNPQCIQFGVKNDTTLKSPLISDLKMEIFTCCWWCCINNKLLFKWCC